MATAVLLGGMIPGAQASQARTIDAELAYTCDSPQGKQPVKVAVAAELPDSARAGDAIQPEGVALDVTLPKEILAATPGSGVATVTAETRLVVDVSQDDQHARTEWIGRTTDSVPVSEEDGLSLSTSGSVPYVKPGGSGDLTFAAGALSVEVSLKTAKGTPAEPRSVSLNCLLDADQETNLAKLDIGDSGTDSPESPASPASPSAEKHGKGTKIAPEVGAKAEPPASPDAPRASVM
ncbi:DUF6801 domain-containing protein [Streptomyces sp. RKAG290]|uniref:DUF6801 domain-containing protein n=1 Tax=Streptomyces sp. RKAG290 TaxID=2888348 RepID=UPI0020337687|nr:DUF6801 domain-containing protein [Streptomyces sp. RKAG290]MCM2410444.1 hypothetical protein [Streptomyces sp. RKAG290]